MLGQVQPWCYTVDFSYLAPNEVFSPEVFLPFIVLLKFTFWIVLQLVAKYAFVHMAKWQA